MACLRLFNQKLLNNFQHYCLVSVWKSLTLTECVACTNQPHGLFRSLFLKASSLALNSPSNTTGSLRYSFACPTLKTHGYLVLGKCELLPTEVKYKFEIIDTHNRIYQRKS